MPDDRSVYEGLVNDFDEVLRGAIACLINQKHVRVTKAHLLIKFATIDDEGEEHEMSAAGAVGFESYGETVSALLEAARAAASPGSPNVMEWHKEEESE